MTPKNIFAKWQLWSPQLQSVLRIVAAFLFIQPGMMKLFAYPFGMPPDGGTAKFFTEIWFAGALELFGGGFLLLGWFTRPVAFLLSGEMAIAYFQAHAPNGFWPLQNGGGEAVIYCFLWFYFSAAGAGPWSIDALRRK